MTTKKRTKKRTKNKSFYLTVYSLLQTGKNPSNISKLLNMSPQSVKYYTDFLKERGFLEKIGYGTWETKRNIKELKKELKIFSIGPRPKTNLHALNIKIPILKGKINDKDWEKKEKLSNWTPTYLKLDVLGGLTVKNNNNKSIIVYCHQRNIKSVSEADKLALKAISYLSTYFKKRGVILDTLNSEVKNLNLATEDREAEGMIRKGERFELNLNKKAEKIFHRDNIDAKAWIDGSPFDFSAETNDKEWKRAYLNMPFRINELLQLLEIQTKNTLYLAENMKAHIPAIKSLSRSAESQAESAKKIVGVVKKLNKTLSQKKINDFR